jgi:L-aspartate oxidase
MIPVTPAAHFLCGGVKIDENGLTTIKNLYAIGETACSGVHGANRLASNSLLECLVYASRAFESSKNILKASFDEGVLKNFKVPNYAKAAHSPDFIKNWKTIRHISWDYLGITRSNQSLSLAAQKIAEIKEQVDSSFLKAPLSRDGLEMRNIVCIADIIARSALLRKESRGAHFNVDYPAPLKNPQNTIIKLKPPTPKRTKE